jgi:secreted trypsin-like serine protease
VSGVDHDEGLRQAFGQEGALVRKKDNQTVWGFGATMARSMRRSFVILVVLGALAVSGSAFGVVGGTADTTHTYVGAALQPQVHDGQVGVELCSGFMIGPTSFVTAAHCFDPNGATILVTFDADLHTATHFTTATVQATHDDIAVLTLAASQPVWAALPGLNTSSSASSIDVVGYGIEGLDPKKSPTAFGERKLATTPVKSAGSQSDVYLKLLASPGGCFGDSGGPNFISGTSAIVAITSGGSKNCNGVSYAERIDTADALNFLTPYANS